MIKKLILTAFILFQFFGFSQQDYYNDVDLTKSGIALKEELATKITATHTNFLSYTPDIWEASKTTDVNPDNSNEVLLIYGYSSSGITGRTREVNNNGGDNGEWNREHVYPRSLGDPNLGSSGPGADAHHLRPCDVQYNSQRNSKKFAEGSGNSGNVSGGWYPGDEWKGDVARIIMYMYLRYGDRCLPTTVGVGNATFTPDNMIDLFLKWNTEDPVSEIEEIRNNYHGDTSNMYAQGNRNPFIDNPNLATQIWGGSVAENRWTTVSIDKMYFSRNIKIYPNPSLQGKINIVASENISEIKVFSISGREVFFRKNPVFKNQKLTINNLKEGIYLFKISNDTKFIIKKLVAK